MGLFVLLMHSTLNSCICKKWNQLNNNDNNNNNNINRGKDYN